MEGALGRRAEAVFAALDPEVQAAFPEVFQELTAIAAGEAERVAARSASWEELTATPARRQLVEAMVAARLFSADRIKDSAGDSRAVVRVAHEALFRAWKRLKDWLEQERENLRVRSRIEAAADRWQAEDRRPDLLLPAGKPLEEALPLITAGHAQLPAAEQQFIRASQARARRFRRLKQTAVALLVLLTFLAGAGAFLANHQLRQAQHHLGLALNEKAAEAARALNWNESRLYSLLALARFTPGRDPAERAQAYGRLLEQRDCPSSGLPPFTLIPSTAWPSPRTAKSWPPRLGIRPCASGTWPAASLWPPSPGMRNLYLGWSFPRTAKSWPPALRIKPCACGM